MDLRRGGQRPFDRFIAPARVRPQVWRLLAGMVLVLALAVGFSALCALAVYWRYGPIIAYGVVLSVSRGATPGGVLMLLYSFAGLLLGAIAAARLCHGRPAGTLFGAPVRRVAGNFGRVFAAVFGIGSVVAALSVATGQALPAAGRGAMVTVLPFALAGLLIQVTAEEAFFRGYLLQQLAARYAKGWVWMGLPAVMFALGHWQPDRYGPAAWFVVAWAGLFGLAAADLTARTGTLGAAIGFHAASNAVALFVVGMKGDLDGLALWVVPLDTSSITATLPTLGVDVLSIVAGWLAARVALRV